MKSIHKKIIIIAAFISLACTTKVSEWVLLNNPAADYTLVCFSRDQPSDALNHQNTEISNTIRSANIRFKSILKEDVSQSYYALYYKNRLFSKYNNTREMQNLTSSPLREKISKELMAGKLCVMLYLKTDIKEKDEIGIETIKKSISNSPFGGIIPLIELSRSDLNEKHFISMLLNVESDLKDINEPMLFGIYGRFRALEPLVAMGITGENVNLMIDFLTADCSCLIKDDLPGTDILFTNNWENPAPALVNKILDENPSLLHR